MEKIIGTYENLDLSLYYPWNVAYKCFVNSPIKFNFDPKEELDVQIKNALLSISVSDLLENITFLSYKHSTLVIDLRYREGMSYEACGKELDLTTERIRQIDDKAIRTLTSKRNEWYIPEMKYYIQRSERLRAKNEQQFDCKLADDEIKKVLYNCDLCNYRDQCEIYDARAIPVECLNLSVRTRRCLYRKGIETLHELSKTPVSELMNTRNFGKVSLEEVKITLAKYEMDMIDDLNEENTH